MGLATHSAYHEEEHVEVVGLSAGGVPNSCSHPVSVPCATLTTSDSLFIGSQSCGAPRKALSMLIAWNFENAHYIGASTFCVEYST